MKVEGPQTPALSRLRRKTVGGASESDFASALESEMEATSSTANLSGTAASAGVGTILSVQEAEAFEGDAAKERAKSRAEELLRKLEILRLDLLMGVIPHGHLAGLAQSVKSVRETVFDPRLTEILDEIDLRAQVELAKYDPYR
jgi:hypothetical protein